MTPPQLIAADSHVNELGDLWVARIVQAFRDRAPCQVSERLWRPQLGRERRCVWTLGSLLSSPVVTG